MAKIIAPLHSDTASGSIGKTLTFRRDALRAVAHRKIKASTSRTFQQAARRTAYTNGCAAWRALTPEERAQYNEDARAAMITGFNLWMRNWLNAWTPPQPGTVWDGGATTWDGGSTVWDS